MPLKYCVRTGCPLLAHHLPFFFTFGLTLVFFFPEFLSQEHTTSLSAKATI